MKNILIALDYDPSAEKVAEAGHALAKAMQSGVILLHVLADVQYYLPLDYSPIMGYSGMQAIDLMEPMPAEELEKGAYAFLQSSKDHLGDASIETMVIEGEFADSILKVAAEKEAGVIVVGTHSRGAIEKIIMGSVTEKLLHNSSIPLFIVPTRKNK